MRGGRVVVRRVLLRGGVWERRAWRRWRVWVVVRRVVSRVLVWVRWVFRWVRRWVVRFSRELGEGFGGRGIVAVGAVGKIEVLVGRGVDDGPSLLSWLSFSLSLLAFLIAEAMVIDMLPEITEIF